MPAMCAAGPRGAGGRGQGGAGRTATGWGCSSRPRSPPGPCMGETRNTAELGWGGSAARGDQPRRRQAQGNSPGSRPPQRDLDPSQILLHLAEQVRQVAGAVRLTLRTATIWLSWMPVRSMSAMRSTLASNAVASRRSSSLGGGGASGGIRVSCASR